MAFCCRHQARCTVSLDGPAPLDDCLRPSSRSTRRLGFSVDELIAIGDGLEAQRLILQARASCTPATR
jgi:hypothetical protein